MTNPKTDRPRLFEPRVLPMLIALQEAAHALQFTRNPDSPEFKLGCLLGVVMGAVSHAEFTGDLAPINSLISHTAQWTREQVIGGEKVGDVVERFVAEAAAAKK